MLSIRGLATNSALTAMKSGLENKTSNSSSLVKKQIVARKLLKLKRKLLTLIIINLLVRQNLIT